MLPVVRLLAAGVVALPLLTSQHDSCTAIPPLGVAHALLLQLPIITITRHVNETQPQLRGPQQAVKM